MISLFAYLIVKADLVSVGPHIEPLLQPIAIDEVKLLDHIPYARRRITEVVVPGPSVDKPAYLSQLCCILTVPSPWTEAEGWRRSPRADHPTDDEGLSDAGDGPLELELATVEEPEQLAIWVERSVLVDDPSGQCLIGMALRGRWGLFGDPSNGEGNKWWAFKSKNCKLLLPGFGISRIDAVCRYSASVVVRSQGR